jgi:hypothetical protein
MGVSENEQKPDKLKLKPDIPASKMDVLVNFEDKNNASLGFVV